MMADITSKKRRGEELGYVYMAVGYSDALAMLIAGITADILDFRMVFLISGFISLISTLPLIKLQKTLGH
jgi:MFS family permease